MQPHTVLLTIVLASVWTIAPQVSWAQDAFRSGYFQTSDGVELHYLEAGEGPTMVFVPGGSMPAEIWGPQLRHFSETHRVIAFDPRSQGRSEKPTDGHHRSRRGQDIGELLEHLDGPPAVVVAWSLGVLELLTYADEFGTDRLRALVLVDMSIGVDEGPDEPHPLQAVWSTWISGSQLNRRQWTREWVRSMFRSEQTEEYLDDITERVLRTPTNTRVTLLANSMLMEERDLRPALEALDRPVLYVVTEALADHAEDVRRRKPDLRLEVFEDAGHALFVDEPDRFNRVLDDFMAALPES